MLKLEIIVKETKITGDIRRAARRAAKAAASVEGKKGRLRVSLLFTDEDNIERLNARYRGMDKPTDVLSFPSGESYFLGDIALSLPRARRQAEEFGHSVGREVAFLTAHSMLHLFGYNHEDAAGETAMREKQRQIMKKAGFEL
ncbi:MAG: rRNA maturation RNase YbeY [Christensenellales bacterium]|jgi:probable rRNA maturation factor